jgi:hypothetical protein
MRECPLDFIVAVDLGANSSTMLVRLTLCEILRHSLVALSRTTGTSPS